MKFTRFLPLLLIVVLCSFAERSDSPIAIFMIGDSTMANKKLDGGEPERGWGQMLPGYLSEDVEVHNHAVNGQSSKTFLNSGRWDAVMDSIRPGDYVFIQFGHNDQPNKGAKATVAGGDFNDNLRRYVLDARSKGAIPVLFTSVVRRKFGPDSLLVDTHGAYISATRDVAAELNVPLIDMHEISRNFVQAQGPDNSKNFFMHLPAGKIVRHPEGKADDTHFNIRGARVMASMAVKEITRTIPQLAPFIRHYDFVVAKDGSGDFFTVQEAIDAVPDMRNGARTSILICKGVYREKIVIPASKINLSLIGREGAVISYDDYADKMNIFGEPMGTSGSATCYVFAPDFYAENITFENSAGQVGQAVAMRVTADRAAFRNCRFLGNQDTLYTHGTGRQYYENCYIEGTVDFIFGKATALFSACTIHAKRSGGYLTAPATPEGIPHGLVFLNCRLTADSGVENVYLGRPWRDYGRTEFISCEMGAHIHPHGWHNWRKPHRETTSFLAECANTGAGAATGQRAFGHVLASAENYTPGAIISGADNWTPWEITSPAQVQYP